MRRMLLCAAIVGAAAVRTAAGDGPGAPSAPPSSAVPDAHVEEALVAAGKNRAELERFLARYAGADDPEKREASRFLVANMGGKGYAVFELRDGKGGAIPYDPLSFPTFPAAQEALDAIEKERGTVDFARAKVVADV